MRSVLQLLTLGDKYRIKVDISNINSGTIKTTIENRLSIIAAKKKRHYHNNSENAKERKIYNLPEFVFEHVGTKHLVSYVTLNNISIIDIPLYNYEDKQHDDESIPSQANDSHHHHYLLLHAVNIVINHSTMNIFIHELLHQKLSMLKNKGRNYKWFYR